MKEFQAAPSSRHKDVHTAECRVCGPPYIFKHKPTERLFLEYSFHIRRVTVSSLLGIYILLTAVLAILHFAYQRTPTEKNLYHMCLCVLGIILYIFINTKYLATTKQLKIVSYLLWILLLLFAFISLPSGPWINNGLTPIPSDVSVGEGIWQLMFIIYCMYLLLPVNFFMSLVLGIVLSLVHIAIILIRLQDVSLMIQSWPQVMVTGVLLVVTNAVGIMAHHVGEKSQRQSFINCRAYIAAKLESQEQGQKLVKVTETCLPKFMCNEVCADLTMYNNIVCPRQVFPKSYDGVSIACINITGLEKLKAQTDHMQYVSLINDLTVTFEALCETHNCLAMVLLGDVYVAVSGIPLSDPLGPQSCVSLCLDMIQAVQLIQQTKCSAVEPLTAVHLGSVATGVVGTYRWQYKCCSSDMLLARDVASNGSPRMVCVTEPCLTYLPLNVYEVQQSNYGRGSAMQTYYIQPISTNRKLSPAVMKLNRRLNQIESVANLMRLESMEDDGPFFTQLFRSNDSKPAMTTCLLEGKAFVHRLAHDNVDNDATNKAFQQAVKIGSVEHETSEQLSFFTLRFLERLMETSFIKESKGFGLSLAFILLLLLAIAILHFTLLPRTMLMLSSVLFLFILLSLLCIVLIASKLRVIKCRCLSQHGNRLALLIITIIMIACSCLVNLLTCRSSNFYHLLPMALRYGILSSTTTQNVCSSPYFMFLSGVLVLFVISVTRISHIVQSVMIVLVTAAYTVIIAYTHGSLFELHDDTYRESLPPATVMAIVALLHFALLHILIGRHSEWVRRLDYIWKHKKTSSYQNAQDMVTLRLGVAENTLPAHVLGHYSNPECVVKPYCNSHSLAGVAFVTIPNLPGFVNDMHRTNQPLVLMQVLHDVTSAFDHLLRRHDFQLIEKVYDDGLTYVLVSGINHSPIPYMQPGAEQDYTMRHLCKLLDLLLDMKHCLLQLNAMSGRNLVLRAGVAIGPVIEGVVGYKKPQYNIWGTAVETARMLELSGKMNHIQVNKEIAQLLRRRFQFQPRSHGNMPVLQELQPYVVVSRRLQSVIASDNESVGSEGVNYGARSPRVHNHSMGSISQAETVLVSSQQHPLASGQPLPRVRIPSYEMRTDTPSGLPYPSNSGNSTPSGSFTRNLSRDGTFMDSVFKMPQTTSLTKLSARPMSPCELPTVHYSKNKTPPIGRMPTSDSRGTIILTQANLTGAPAAPPPNIIPQSSSYSMSSGDFIQPSVSAYQQSSLPKVANVVTTDSISSKRKQQLSPVGEMAMVRDHSRQSSSSTSSLHAQGRTTPNSYKQGKSAASPLLGGRVTPGSVSSNHSSQRGKISANGFAFSAPQSPPPQARMSPALSYTRSTPPLRLPSRTPSQSSSHRNSPVVTQAYFNSDRFAGDNSEEFKDTAPLLSRIYSSPHEHRPVEQSVVTEPKSPKKGLILGLDRMMTSSIYSDKMQTSMEGNVSSTSTTPDEDAPLMMKAMLCDQYRTNQEVPNINSDPSLSPLLKHQLNRFARARESVHKSPHLPRKHTLSHSNSTGSRTGGASTICSLSPPSTPLDTTNQPSLTQASGHTANGQQDNLPDGDEYFSTEGKEDHSGKLESNIVQEADNSHWSGARPKHFNNIPSGKLMYHTDGPSPPALPNPPPPLESATESELSEISDDDNEHVSHVYDTNITDYDNMYSTDYGTYDNRSKAAIQCKLKNGNGARSTPAVASPSSKFMSKLERMQRSGQNIGELYSEIESDAADSESLVGDTDYETEPMSTPSRSHDNEHPLHRLQWTENHLLALLKPSTGAASTMGSTLRHCRSMELLPSESEEVLNLPHRRQRHNKHHMSGSQLFDDNMSIMSSMYGSEISRSDPNLSDIGAYESEYDNYRPGPHSDDDFFANKPIRDIDLNQFGNIDFDKIKVNENMTTQDYILNLQRHIENKQRGQVVTDV